MGGHRPFSDQERTPLITAPESKKGPKMRPPMRSSIACMRCRKSKIKCENQGPGPPCSSCLKAGRECRYEPGAENPVRPKRPDPPAAVRQDRDGGSERKRLRSKFDDVSRDNQPRADAIAEEVLSAQFLSEEVWETILDLYKLHFATELPFLHLPTLKEKLGRRFRPQPAERDQELNVVLLGVLTLTARFHSGLIQYLAHGPLQQSARTARGYQLDPTEASEYYADVLQCTLGLNRNAIKVASVERVQAWLMLGLFEWSQVTPKTGALGAWNFIGIAIRLAHYLSLGFGDGDDEMESSHSNRGSRAPSDESQIALDKEVKRRTMFSCFTLDRMLSCGKERVCAIHLEDLEIQLPCGEDKFDLAMEVKTGKLTDPIGRSADESVLSRFVRLVAIWGDISKYSSRGGRLRETKPPWDPTTRFYQLNKTLDDFDLALPSGYQFSRSNYFKHENHQASSVYVLLHMLRGVSLIMLHREYIPFIPIRCAEPEGPLDKPTFPRDQFETPGQWWRKSAEQVFKAARDIVDLIEICERKNRLPQSTIVLFAIWTASFVGLYAHHFPQMDVERHMLSYQYQDPDASTHKKEFFQEGAIALTYRTLNKMSTFQQMASTYMTVLREMNDYFLLIIKDYHRYKAADQAQEGGANLSVRRGGSGGGLEEYLGRTELKDFGTLRPSESRGDDRQATSGVPDRTHAPENGGHGADRASRPGSASFTAINHTNHKTILPAPRDPSQSPVYQHPGTHGHPPDVYGDQWRRAGPSFHPTPPGGAFDHPHSLEDEAAAAHAAMERVNGNVTGFVNGSITGYAAYESHLARQQHQRFTQVVGDQSLFARGEPPDPYDQGIPFTPISYLYASPPDSQYSPFMPHQLVEDMHPSFENPGGGMR